MTPEEAIERYWAAETPDAEALAYAWMLANGMPRSYGESDEAVARLLARWDLSLPDDILAITRDIAHKCR